MSQISIIILFTIFFPSILMIAKDGKSSLGNEF